MVSDVPFISIIILNWNGREITDKCLESFFQITEYLKDRVKVILIDNNSEDDSVSFLKDKYKEKIDLIALENNFRFIKSNNLGIEYCLEKYNPDYILLLNNDMEIIQHDWLQKIVETAEEDKNIGIVGPKLIFPDGKIQWSGRRREKNIFFLILQTMTARMNPGFGEDEEEATIANFIGDVNTISGACMLIRSKLINEIGFLDISLYPMYQEDVEYCFRTWNYGYKVVYRGDVKLVHYEGYSTNKREELEDKKFYWALRNSIIVSKKYFGFLRVCLVGLPLFIFVTLFDKRKKNKKLSIYNLKFRDNILYRIYILIKSIYMGLIKKTGDYDV